MNKATLRPTYCRERYPQDIAQEAGWTPGPVWLGAENFITSGFDTRTVICNLPSNGYRIFIFLCSILRPWWWRQQDPPKTRCVFARLHGVRFRETSIFMVFAIYGSERAIVTGVAERLLASKHGSAVWS